MLLVIFLAGTEPLAERWSAPRFATGIAVALALAGARFSVWAPGSVPRGMPVLFQLRRGIVTYSPK